jgi:hypothetical protein
MDAEGVSESGENYIGVRYDLLVPLLVEAIKNQQRCIDELRNRLDALTTTAELLKRRHS